MGSVNDNNPIIIYFLKQNTVLLIISLNHDLLSVLDVDALLGCGRKSLALEVIDYSRGRRIVDIADAISIIGYWVDGSIIDGLVFLYFRWLYIDFRYSAHITKQYSVQ